MTDRVVSSGVRSALWVFTINNYTQDDLNAVRSIKSPLFVVYGIEKGNLGTPHLQGFVEHVNGIRIMRSQLERLLGGRAWLNPARGTEVQCIGYCIKDGAWACNLIDAKKYILMRSWIDKHREINNKCTDWLGCAFLNGYYSDESWFKEWDTIPNVEHLYDQHVHACCDRCKCKRDFCLTCYYLSQFDN